MGASVHGAGARATARAAAASSAPGGAELDEFCDAIWLEDGLARNSIDSYRRDLAQFADWLAQPPRSTTLLAAGRAELLDYLAHRVRIGARASSSGRPTEPGCASASSAPIAVTQPSSLAA